MPQPASHSQPHSQFRLLQGPTSPFPHIVDPAGPTLRTGSYVPDWLLERRKRAESALITVVAHAGLVRPSSRTCLERPGGDTAPTTPPT